MVEILLAVLDSRLQVVKVEQVVFGQIVEAHAHCFQILYLCPLGQTVACLYLRVV